MSLFCSVVWRVVCATPLYSFGIALSKIIACTTLGMMMLAAMRCWKLSFISMISMAGLAAEIFLEIAFLKSAKIAEGPVVPKAAWSTSHTSLAVSELFGTTATEGFTQRRIVP